jgi:hypothetical protein
MGMKVNNIARAQIKAAFADGVRHCEDVHKKVALEAAVMQVYGTSISLSEYQKQLKAARSMTIDETELANEKLNAIPKKASKQRGGSTNGRWVERDAGAVTRALEWLKANDFSLEKHYRTQMRSLGSLGLDWVEKAEVDGGVPKPQRKVWLTKTGEGRGVRHTHVHQLKCAIRSQASPLLVDKNDGLTTELLQQRPKRILLLLQGVPEFANFCSAQMPEGTSQ